MTNSENTDTGNYETGSQEGAGGNHKNYSVTTYSDMGLPICTALAAVVFALCNTLGSGSYLEAFPVDYRRIVQSLLTTVTAFFAVGFSVSLYHLLSSMLRLGKPKKYNIAALQKAQTIFFKVALFLLCALAIAVSSTFVSSNYNQENTLVVLFVVSFTIGTLVFFGLLFYLIRDVLATDVVGFVVSVVIFAGSSVVWLNQYRDAYKSALANDSEYCYWLKTSLSEYTDDPTCFNLNNRGNNQFIEHDAYRVNPQ